MGMFDTIYLHNSLIPVIPELQERGIQIGSEDDLQTKDLECCMFEYRVGEDRKLMLRKSEYKTVETPGKIFPFYLEEVDHEMIHDTTTCEAYCCFYQAGTQHGDEDIWLDLKVVIIRGIVDTVELHKLEITPSSSRLAQMEKLHEDILQREKDPTQVIRRKLASLCGRIANFINKIQYALLRS